MKLRNASHIISIVLSLFAITFGLAPRAQAQTETILYNFPGSHTGGCRNPG
jgi:hypothetical protein